MAIEIKKINPSDMTVTSDDDEQQLYGPDGSYQGDYTGQMNMPDNNISSESSIFDKTPVNAYQALAGSLSSPEDEEKQKRSQQAGEMMVNGMNFLRGLGNIYNSYKSGHAQELNDPAAEIYKRKLYDQRMQQKRQLQQQQLLQQAWEKSEAARRDADRLKNQAEANEERKRANMANEEIRSEVAKNQAENNRIRANEAAQRDKDNKEYRSELLKLRKEANSIKAAKGGRSGKSGSSSGTPSAKKLYDMIAYAQKYAPVRYKAALRKAGLLTTDGLGTENQKTFSKESAIALWHFLDADHVFDYYVSSDRPPLKKTTSTGQVYGETASRPKKVQSHAKAAQTKQKSKSTSGFASLGIAGYAHKHKK
jgi:hypothetical protein